MTIPAIFLGFVLSTFYAAGFHLLRGGGAAHFLFYIVLSWLGFWGGHFLAEFLGWSFFKIGPLNLAFATIGSGIFLLIGRWLSRVEVGEEDKGSKSSLR